jgi:hypothetical protein
MSYIEIYKYWFSSLKIYLTSAFLWCNFGMLNAEGINMKQ